MALDPSIILQAGRGITQFDPIGVAEKAMSMKHAMQQQQIGALQLQQQQQTMSDNQAVRAAIANGEDPVQAMLKTGNVKGAHEAATAGLQTTKAQHDAQKAQLELKAAWNGRIAQLAQGATDQASYDRALQQAASEGIPGVENMPKVYDPGAVRTLQAQAMTAKDYWQKLLDEQELAIKKNAFSGFHAGADQTAYQVNPQGQARQIMGPDGKPLRVPPPQTAITLQQMNSTYDGSTPMNPGLESIAKAIAKGDQDMLVSARTMPKFADINARAAYLRDQAGQGDLLGKSQVGARAAGIKDFEPQGKSGQTIVALNTMTEHLNTAERLAQALKNGDVQMINKLRQSFQAQTGQPAPTDFATVKQFLAGEVAKVASGGHLTDAEIKQAADRLSSAQSPEQLSGALNVMREIAGGKLVALNQDYTRLTGKTLSDAGRLTPATQKAFQTANAHIQGGDAKPSGALPYAGKTLPKAVFQSLSAEDRAKFISGGGRAI